MSLFRAYINDRSISGFSSSEELGSALMAILEARRIAPNLNRALYCSKATSLLVGADGANLLSAAQNFERPTRSAVLQWLGRMGPFLEDAREPTEDDLYYLVEEDVTNEGLGEAARQRQRGHDGRVVSLSTGNGFDARQNSIALIQGLLEEPVASVEVPNHHKINELILIANDAIPEPTNWIELMAYCRNRFGDLLIGPHCDRVLSPHPFFGTVARRTIELLKVLNEISAERDGAGALSARGEALKQDFFVGDKAWFSDEGGDNKVDFGKAMTFPDPGKESDNLQCFWHGKIKTPQFRIHFDWPNPPPGEPLKVAYIGPKISKR